MYETIEIDDAGGVARVSLNRPSVRNAFNDRMILELTDAFLRLAQRQDIRAIVLRGNGRVFSAGADMHWMRASLDLSAGENVADALRMSDMFEAIDLAPQPTLCRVHGAALGGGMGLIACCDIVLAEEKCIFGFTEVKLGIIPAVISRFVVPKIGQSWARALFTTGERFGADVARDIGLVHWTVASDELDEAIDGKVGELLSSGPRATREAKQLVRGVISAPPETVRAYTAERIAALRTGEEGQEGLRAFLEKREASWRGDA